MTETQTLILHFLNRGLGDTIAFGCALEKQYRAGKLGSNADTFLEAAGAAIGMKLPFRECQYLYAEKLGVDMRVFRPSDVWKIYHLYKQLEAAGRVAEFEARMSDSDYAERPAVLVRECERMGKRPGGFLVLDKDGNEVTELGAP